MNRYINPIFLHKHPVCNVPPVILLHMTHVYIKISYIRLRTFVAVMQFNIARIRKSSFFVPFKW